MSCGATVRPDVRVGHCPRAGHSGSTMAIRGARNQNSHSTVSVPTEEISFSRSTAGPRFCPRVGDAAETQAGCELLTGILGLRTVSFFSPEGPARTQRRGAGGEPGSGRVTRRAAEERLAGLIIRHWNQTSIRSHHGGSPHKEQLTKGGAMRGHTDHRACTLPAAPNLRAGDAPPRPARREQRRCGCRAGARHENRKPADSRRPKSAAASKATAARQASRRAVVVRAGTLSVGPATRVLLQSPGSRENQRPPLRKGQGRYGEPAWWPGSGGHTPARCWGPSLVTTPQWAKGKVRSVDFLIGEGHASGKGGSSHSAVHGMVTVAAHTPHGAPEDGVPRGRPKETRGPSEDAAPQEGGRPLTRFGPSMGSS